MCINKIRFISLSSTTKALSFSIAGCASCGSMVAAAVPIKNGTVKVKVLPLSGALSSSISPFISRISRAEMESPSPVPPNSRVVDESPCEKASKICCCLSLGIPMPVSKTEKRMGMNPSADWRRCARTLTSPSFVNLMALPARLIRIWRKRVGSPRRTSGTSPCKAQVTSNFFCWARTARGSNALSMQSSREKGTLSRSSRPASIFEKSRMSLMIPSKDSADDRTISRYSRCSGLSSVSSASSVMPRIPFMGVRISWLMLARNSLLARLAASAACLASTRRCSAARCLVMSSITPTYPCKIPSVPASARVCHCTQFTWPSGVRNRY